MAHIKKVELDPKGATSGGCVATPEVKSIGMGRPNKDCASLE